MNKYKTSKWVKTHALPIKEAFHLLSIFYDNGDPLQSNGISKAQQIDIFKIYLKELQAQHSEDFDLCSDKKTQYMAAKIVAFCL